MMNTIVFFNNKGGVGKTTSIYHVAWMLSELGHKVLAVDLDPQCNLSSMFLSEERLAEIVNRESGVSLTILDSLEPITEGEAYVPVHIESISDNENISLLIGDLSLSSFEDQLSKKWTDCLNGEIFAFKISSIFKTLLEDASKRSEADYILIDVGPNLGAINRSVLISTNFIIIPVAPDLFSLQGMKNLGAAIKRWKEEWEERVNKFPPNKDKSLLADGKMLSLGYIIMQYSAKEDRPVKAFSQWFDRIPNVYNEHILKTILDTNVSVNNDPNKIAFIKHYHSLAPLSQEARKPMFLLKHADGAIGSHAEAVTKCHETFEALSYRIIARINETR